MSMTEKLDDMGKPAWIGLMVVSFIVFWPVGLGLLAFLIWSGRMGCGRHARHWHEARHHWKEHLRASCHLPHLRFLGPAHPATDECACSVPDVQA